MSASDRLRAPNHRGIPLPRTLWIPPLVAGIATGLVGAVVVRAFAEQGGQGAPALVATLGCALVTAAGLVDDLLPQRARGVRGHLRALADGHLTTGLLKALVIVGSAVVVVATFGGRSAPATVAGVVVLAASANLWNGLDVAPARASKAYLAATTLVVVVAAAASVRGWSGASVCVGVTLGAIVALPFDLRERAMLGDAGANLLGFALGIWLLTLSSDTVLIALGVVLVAANVAAETVSLSRLIDAVPPLRWFDRLGRLRDDPAAGPDGSGPPR
jgi:UDP-N-acetylmuramyl pentapeptide phosphotransferase/UDP-N-acetylglucosamine-1-phosphate transferase